MTTLRELSHGEAAFHNGFTSIPVMSQIEGNFPKNIVQYYLDKWIESHPVIGCKVTETNSKLYFEDQGKRNHKIEEVYCEDTSSAEKHFENVVNSLIEQNSLIEAYLFRVHNSQTTYLVTNLSHVISDGVCNIELHRYLLENTDNYIKSKKQSNALVDTEISVPVEGTKLVPYPIEEYLVPRFDGIKTEDIVAQDLNFFDRQDHRILSDRKVNIDAASLHPASKAMKVMSFEFDAYSTRQLVKWCKAHNVSVNNALVASFLKATGQHIGGDCNHILVRQAINLRQKVAPHIANDVYITSASSIVSSFTIKDKDSVGFLCKQVSEITQRESEFAPTLQNHIANKEIFRAKRLPLALHFSNLGKLDLKTQYTHFKLRRFIVCPSANLGETIPLLISTLGDRLTITCHANKKFFSEELITKLVDTAMGTFFSEAKVAHTFHYVN